MKSSEKTLSPQILYIFFKYVLIFQSFHTILRGLSCPSYRNDVSFPLVHPEPVSRPQSTPTFESLGPSPHFTYHLSWSRSYIFWPFWTKKLVTVRNGTHSTRTHVSRVRLVVPREVTSSSRGTWRAFIGFTRLTGGGKTFGPCDYCEPTSTGGCCNSSFCSWDEVNRVERERKTNGRQLERLKCVEGGKERKRDREGESESRWLARRTGRCTTSSEKVRRRVWLSSWMSNVRRYRRTFVLNVHHALRQRLHISMKK